jgi:signal transduction histidine kinase
VDPLDRWPVGNSRWMDRDAGFQAVIEAAPVAGEPEPLLEFAAATERGIVLAGCTKTEARRLVTMVLVARLLCEAAAAPGKLRSSRGMIACGTRLSGLSEAALRLAAGELALRDARTGAQPPPEAIRTQLRLVASVAALREVSLWLPGADGRLEVAAEVDGPASSGVARTAQRTFHNLRATPPSATRQLVGVPVGQPPEAIGVLAGRVPRGLAGLAVRVLRSAAPQIALALARRDLIAEAEAAGASERALVRFGFDVHDGPAQGIAGLLADIRAFKGQIEAAFAGDSRVDLLTGRLEDLEARSGVVADQIRRVARAARGPAAEDEPVEEVLRGELQAMREVDGGLKCELEVHGPVDAATPSQRIALLRGVQEALRNVREHAGARRVSVRVEAGAERTEAEVRDDGCGFDPERVLAEASPGGRMGLAGIAERARLLGGECEVRSAPGGPTSIRISLPRWESREER